MVVGWTLHALTHGSLKCSLEHCNPCRKPTERFEVRQKYRKKLLDIWLNSVSDDLDMITDWWFFYRMYGLYGIDFDDGPGSRATLALLVFCALGSLGYVIELYQTAFKPDSFKWLPMFTIFFEDVPQILLTLFLSDRLAGYSAAPTALAAFNISTSVYHAIVKVSGPVFLNYCYCCSFSAADAAALEEEDRYFEAGSVNVEEGGGGAAPQDAPSKTK